MTNDLFINYHHLLIIYHHHHLLIDGIMVIDLGHGSHHDPCNEPRSEGDHKGVASAYSDCSQPVMHCRMREQLSGYDQVQEVIPSWMTIYKHWILFFAGFTALKFVLALRNTKPLVTNWTVYWSFSTVKYCRGWSPVENSHGTQPATDLRLWWWVASATTRNQNEQVWFETWLSFFVIKHYQRWIITASIQQSTTVQYGHRSLEVPNHARFVVVVTVVWWANLPWRLMVIDRPMARCFMVISNNSQ